MAMWLALAGVGGLVALVSFMAGWYVGRRSERDVGRMLQRQRQGLDPYGDEVVMEQEETE